jgi:hypothetical protein
MPRFVAINDKPVNENNVHELTDFFVEHLFFKFMDSGRKGLDAGIQDLIVTAEDRVILSQKTKADQERIQLKFAHNDIYAKLFKDHSQKIMSAFITGGTGHMRNAIFQALIDPLLFA